MRCAECSKPLVSIDECYPHKDRILCKVCWFDIPRPGTRIEYTEDGRCVLIAPEPKPVLSKDFVFEEPRKTTVVFDTYLKGLLAKDEAWRAVRYVQEHHKCTCGCRLHEVIRQQIDRLDGLTHTKERVSE